MHTVFLRGNLQKFCNRFLVKRRLTSYIVLLPEDPVDTPENNVLLRTSKGDLPDFTQITENKCFSGVGKLALDLETGVWEMEEKIRNNPTAVNFKTVLEPLDSLDAQLNLGWSTAKILHFTRQDILPQKTFYSLHERARKARVHKFQSLPIYNACKTILAEESGLGTCEQRVLRKFQLEARLNGIELSPQKADAFLSAVQQLEKRKTEFKQKVKVSSMRFAYNITDPNITKDFSKDLLERMAVNGTSSSTGPWQVTFQPGVYEPFLQQCDRRSLRWNAWQAYNMQASTHLESQLDNSVNIEEIRKYRQDQARILGYPNYAVMSMETKMAGSVENVLSMITSLMAKAVPCQVNEMASLTEFARSRGFEDTALQPFDVPYYGEQMRRELYGDITSTLHEYLPFGHVFSVLLQLTSQLFGVRCEEVPHSTAWHPSVQLYNVLDEGGDVLASFYLDPYKRPGQKADPSSSSGWFLSLRSRSTAGQQPVAALLFNFPPPSDAKGDTLLTLEQVTTLFAKFGEALQHMLTTVPYGEASGLTNIEWDAVHTCQHFMANWVFVPQVLTALTRHHVTGACLTPAAVSGVIMSANHMAGHRLCWHLYLANLDILLHSTTDFWRTIVSNLYPQYMPYPLDRKDEHPCGWSSCLADVWASAYYSGSWSRVLAADCTKAFLAEGEEEWPQLGRRFRSTFLSLGGGERPSEVFRKFRGRDPTPDALTDLYNIRGK